MLSDLGEEAIELASHHGWAPVLAPSIGCPASAQACAEQLAALFEGGMNFKSVPVGRPPVFASHCGVGSQHGKPYYPLGQEANRCDVPRADPRSPLSLSGTAHMQTAPNDRNTSLLRTFTDPPTHRSVAVSTSNLGGQMDSTSHTWKIGSKHLSQPEPPGCSGRTAKLLGRTRSVPTLGGAAELRRDFYKDPTRHHLNAAFTTSGDSIGKFYHSHLMSDQMLLSRCNKASQGRAAGCSSGAC